MIIVVPATLVLLGGMIHTLTKTGRNEQRLNQVEVEIREIKNTDLRDIRNDVQWLTRRLTGENSPSAKRDEESKNGIIT